MQSVSPALLRSEERLREWILISQMLVVLDSNDWETKYRMSACSDAPDFRRAAGSRRSRQPPSRQRFAINALKIGTYHLGGIIDFLCFCLKSFQEWKKKAEQPRAPRDDTSAAASAWHAQGRPLRILWRKGTEHSHSLQAQCPLRTFQTFEEIGDVP